MRFVLGQGSSAPDAGQHDVMVLPVAEESAGTGRIATYLKVLTLTLALALSLSLSLSLSLILILTRSTSVRWSRARTAPGSTRSPRRLRSSPPSSLTLTTP